MVDAAAAFFACGWLRLALRNSLGESLGLATAIVSWLAGVDDRPGGTWTVVKLFKIEHLGENDFIYIRRGE